MPKGTEPIELRPMGGSAPPPPAPPAHPAAGSLHAAYRQAEEKAKAAVHLQEGNLDAISTWGLVVSAWFGILAIPLLLFPRLILFFAQAPPISTLAASAVGIAREEHYDALTPLESHLLLSISLGLIALALISLFVLVPSYPTHPNPSRKPLLGVLVGLTSILSLIALNTTSIGGLGKTLGIGYMVVAVWGWWVVVFGEVKRGEKRSRMPERLKKL